jgi:Enoyl-CoA hydratase/isomerase
MFVRLSRAPVVSIASIRGRATGVGSELALACDMRFASREKAILSQWEVGAGLVPGGGPMARLPRLIGRGRALEVLLGADDIPGDLAELYGYVNRSLPDADLDAFVDAFATRIASFDRQAISETKRFADVASLPPDFEIAPEWDACLASIARPTVMYGGQSLLSLLLGNSPGYSDNPLRHDLWRAGHAHAGVYLVLSLIMLRYVDEAVLSSFWKWLARTGAPIAAILIPAGFFLSVAAPTAKEPNGLMNLAYIGALFLAAAVLSLGVGLIRAARRME